MERYCTFTLSAFGDFVSTVVILTDLRQRTKKNVDPPSIVKMTKKRIVQTGKQKRTNGGAISNYTRTPGKTMSIPS